MFVFAKKFRKLGMLKLESGGVIPIPIFIPNPDPGPDKIGITNLHKLKSDEPLLTTNDKMLENGISCLKYSKYNQKANLVLFGSLISCEGNILLS